MLNTEEQILSADKALRLNGFTPEYNSPIPLPEIKPTLRIKRLVTSPRPKIKGASTSNIQRQLIQNGEAAYTVTRSSCGKKGVFISNPEAIGQQVFVSDADIGTTIKTEIKADKCINCGKSHLGVIELPQHWIGRKVHVRPYQVFSVS